MEAMPSLTIAQDEVVIVLFLTNICTLSTECDESHTMAFWKVYNTLEEDHFEVLWGSSYVMNVTELSNGALDCDMMPAREFSLESFQDEDVMVARFVRNSEEDALQLNFHCGKLGKFLYMAD